MQSRTIIVVLLAVMTGLSGCAGNRSYERTDGSSNKEYQHVTELTPVRKPVWSPWAKLDDGGLNGIEFSHKNECATQGGAIPCTHNWRFNSLYETDVTVEYTIAWDSGAGIRKKTVQARIKPGENRDDSFMVNAVALDELSVRLIADSRVLADARAVVAETRAAEQREIERKRQQAELVARLAAEEQQRQEEARRQQQEAARRQQAADAEYWRQHPEEYQARLAQQRYQEQERARQERRREQAEERRREEEQEERRQARRDEEVSRRQQEQMNRDSNNALMAGLQSMQNSVNQGMNTYNNAAQANRDVDDYLRRQKEERARQAREEQRRQAEYAAQQRRDAEENRRLQQQRAQDSERAAQEQREKTERERVVREAERKATAAKLAKEQAERNKQKKEQVAQNNASQYTESSSGNYALTAEQRQMQLQNLAQAQQKQQQAQTPQQPTQQTQQPETCPPKIWDESNKDKTQFTVYVLNTCQRSRLEVTSINYYDLEHVLCNTMMMPERFQPGSKVIPLDCRKFASDGETWRFPGYKVNYKILY